MDPMVAGLRYRVRRAARQIVAQHQHIDELREELGGHAAAGRVEETRDALVRYRGALQAHFALEDEVFFPALHGLHPECAVDLEALSGEHSGFDTSLAALAEGLAADGLGAFEPRFREVVAALEQHEAREESLVEALAWLAERDED